MGRNGECVHLSVVAPAHDERDNVGPLVEQIEAALRPLGRDFEVVVVDDGSTDGTDEVLGRLQATHPCLRVVRMCDTPPGRGHGQSAAFHAGFRAAAGRLIASLDADLQNDPGDLPAMLAELDRADADVVQGDRSHARRDTAWRKFGSWIGRVFRRGLLGDTVRDTGCSLRVMKREVALAVPLQFRGMHRYIPITARQLGYRVVEVPVHHRPRTAGTTKYGTWDRAIVGIYDCLSVRWMGRRRRPVTYRIIEGAGAGRRREGSESSVEPSLEREAAGEAPR